MNEPKQWMSAREVIARTNPKPPTHKIDPIASEAAGVEIMANDPRLIRWAAEKAKKNQSQTIPTRMIEDKLNRRELAEIFHGKHLIT